ncbi:BglII/BstYI family type II restriction endonuclease [Okeania sp.]|uniref:BglII/BstYI family type II restriction endonuclease n=1 Tax=Okeania sp. TaxID=3100323 RepID=UPI002B4B1EC8|nr:BglII/BstYI family type II restriction endonuclease [Okeania sp.]MEB3339832.1 BglII/BstYI family type II restriction endonuclease [Okeania sp.]
MIIAGIYSFNSGLEVIEQNFSDEFNQVKNVISRIDAKQHKTKISQEKTMAGRMLYKPSSLNTAYRQEFELMGWKKEKIYCEYPTRYYTDNYQPMTPERQPRPYREMDFVKGKVGVEVQFGKYAFMVYNVCAKMTIFHNQNIIDVGIEIVPIKEFADMMSTGVSYFEQFVWDLEHRGVANIDIPVLVLGLAE